MLHTASIARLTAITHHWSTEWDQPLQQQAQHRHEVAAWAWRGGGGGGGGGGGQRQARFRSSKLPPPTHAHTHTRTHAPLVGHSRAPTRHHVQAKANRVTVAFKPEATHGLQGLQLRIIARGVVRIHCRHAASSALLHSKEAEAVHGHLLPCILGVRSIGTTHNNIWAKAPHVQIDLPQPSQQHE